MTGFFTQYSESGERVPLWVLECEGLNIDLDDIRRYNEWRNNGHQKEPVRETVCSTAEGDTKRFKYLHVVGNDNENCKDFVSAQGRVKDNTITLSLYRDGMAKVLCLHQDHPEYTVNSFEVL